MTLPSLKEMAQYDMIVENPLWKLKKYKQGKLNPVKSVVCECSKCHLYVENQVTDSCKNCGLKFEH